MTRCELSNRKDRYYRANMSWGIEKKNDIFKEHCSSEMTSLSFPQQNVKKKKSAIGNGAVLPLSLIKFQHLHN